MRQIIATVVNFNFRWKNRNKKTSKRLKNVDNGKNL